MARDKVVLVTGSSRGIGAAIAREFGKSGARVVVHGRDQSALYEVEATIHNDGGKAMAVTGDVTDFAAIEAMRHTIEERYGPVDILVANAGGNLTPPAPLEDIPEDGWRATIDGNLLATFLTLKSFLPGMKERRSGVRRCRRRRHDLGTPRCRAVPGPSGQDGRHAEDSRFEGLSTDTVRRLEKYYVRHSKKLVANQPL